MTIKSKMNSNPKGGRKKIEDDSALVKRVNWRLNEKDFEKLQTAFKNSGHRFLTDYLKERLIYTSHLYVVNPKDILKQLNTIGEEIGRIGNNLNQLAKHANTLRLSRDIDPTIVEKLNSLLIEYNKERKELSKLMYSFLKNDQEKQNSNVE